ncbi:uncharacterized protein LOC130676203 [Microplitis mediator]|uniref:uncharacterized protein LOC130675884 n=1 Tax=Microplitis mediator TaxID=375433 RepID=UPI002555A73E|nr:uncharacterized protein LOC130675884 [Microplitis mediator]XP_057338252.1 uncharacterized protein LOC130676203 [Microplitis mediator]
MKLILIFVIFNAVSLGTSCSSSGKMPIDAARKGVLVGPNTPVYYLRNGHENLTIEKKTDVLKVSRSVSYYKSPYNFNNNTMFLRILVIVDYELYRKNEEQGIIDYVVKYMSGVDEYFLPFDYPSVKIVLAGIVIATHPDAIKFLKPLKLSDDASLKVMEYSATTFEQFVDVIPLDSFHADEVLHKMNGFLFQYRNIFNHSEYDRYLILASRHLYTGRPPYLSRVLGMTDFASIFLEHRKPSKIPLGAIVDEPLDIYQDTGAHETAHMLNIGHDNSSKCQDGYIMSETGYRNSNSYDWSECSKEALQETFRDEYYSSLLKRPEFLSN